jgi:hypothetical protein
LRSIDNQAAVTRHRVREQLVGQRTALLNALPGQTQCAPAVGERHRRQLLKEI